jgi:hypothetical protein
MAALTQPGEHVIRSLTSLRSKSVVQRMEDRRERKEPEIDSDESSPGVDIKGCCNYSTIKVEGIWNNSELLMQHCLTYCNTKEKVTWVKFAYIVGAPPPELGHGSQLAPQKGKKSKGKGGNKQGSAKDEKRWTDFQNSMERIINQMSGTKGNTDYQKAEKLVKAYDGDTPGWW